MASDKKTYETTLAKKALKEAGYEVVSCKFGRGTARSWIHVKITGAWTDKEFRDNHYGHAYGIVKHAAGRDHLHDDIQTDLFLEKISLDYLPRVPTAEEYAEMGRDALEARADELRTELARLERYGVVEGTTVDQIEADLDGTGAALASLEADEAPYEAPEIVGISDLEAWLEDRAALDAMEHRAATAAFAVRLQALEAEPAPAPKPKTRRGRKSNAEKEAETKAHLSAHDLENIAADTKGLQDFAKQLSESIRAVYGPEADLAREVEVALVALKIVEGNVRGDLDLIRRYPSPDSLADAEQAAMVYEEKRLDAMFEAAGGVF